MTILIQNKNDVEKFKRHFLKIPNNTKEYFKDVSDDMKRKKSFVFRNNGARQEWAPFSPLTLHPSWKARTSAFPQYKGYHYNDTKWRKRKGTDGSVSRYSKNSKMMRASGKFYNSIKVLSLDKDLLVWGTTHRLAKAIMSNPTRQTITVGSRDLVKWTDLLMAYASEQVK